MRHGNKINHLGRKTPHRKAMLSNMASSLILHKRITTTLAKAKALRNFAEPLLTKSKEDSTHNRRTVFSHLQDKNAVAELFRTVSPKIQERNGGYTRIIKLGNRLGDAAEMALIELVDFNELLIKETKPKKTSRRRGGSTKKKSEASSADVTTEAKDKETTDENPEVTNETESAVAEAKAEVEAPVEKPKAEKKPKAKAEKTAEDATETPAAEETPEAKAEDDASPEEDDKNKEE